MKMKTKERKKLSINNKEHIEKKQNTILQFRTLIHYRNEYIRPYYKSYVSTRRKTNSLHVKNHKLNRTKL